MLDTFFLDTGGNNRKVARMRTGEIGTILVRAVWGVTSSSEINENQRFSLQTTENEANFSTNVLRRGENVLQNSSNIRVIKYE